VASTAARSRSRASSALHTRDSTDSRRATTQRCLPAAPHRGSRALATLTRRAGTRQVLHVQRLLHDDARQVHGARHEHPLLRRRVRPDQALARAARSKRPSPRGRPPLPEARPLAWGCALDTRPPERGCCGALVPAQVSDAAAFGGAGGRTSVAPCSAPPTPRTRRRVRSAASSLRTGRSSASRRRATAATTRCTPRPRLTRKRTFALNFNPHPSLNFNPTYPNPNPTSPNPKPNPDQVHASASPFEGLAERTNWLGVAIADDTFGKALLAAGVPEETIKKWSSDPQVTYDAETAKSTGRAARPKRSPWAAPQLAPRASSGRAWRLRAAQHSQGRGRPTGRPATAPGARASRH